MRLTAEREAAYALAHGVSRSDLTASVQAEYDRLLAERRAAATQPAASPASHRQQTRTPGGRPAAATWQGSPLPTRRQHWPNWLLFAAGFTFVAAFVVGGFGGASSVNWADVTAALLFLFSVAAAVVAIPAALVLRSRARRIALGPQAAAVPYAACYRCGYPFAVHDGDSLKCPEAGICYRCGQPFSTHVGYELTCPVTQSP